MRVSGLLASVLAASTLSGVEVALPAAASTGAAGVAVSARSTVAPEPSLSDHQTPSSPRAPQQIPIQRGVALFEAGEFEAAIEILEQVVEARPAFPPARYYLGRALNAAGRFEEALGHLRSGLPSAADPAAFQLAIAQALFELDRLADARAALDAAGELRPALATVPLRVAQVCFRVGNVETAIEELDRAAALAPEWLDPVLRAAEIESGYGDPKRAAAHLSRAVELRPGQPGLWIRYADALAVIADDSGAESAYRSAITANPDSPLAYLALGYFLFNEQRFEEAREPLESILHRFPDDPQVLMPLADIEMIVGNHEAALELADAALANIDATAPAARTALDPVSEAGPVGRDVSPSMLRRNALEVKARVLIGMNRPTEAAATARSLLEADPSNLDGLFVLGTALLRSGDGSGRALLEAFQRLSDAREHRELGMDLLRLAGDLDGAAAELERAIAIDAEDAEALTGLGTVERVRGELDAAIEMLARARRAGADGPEWYREWVLALYTAGRAEEADQAWNESRARGMSLGPAVWAALGNQEGAC